MFTYLFFIVWIYGLERVRQRAFDPAPTNRTTPPYPGGRRGELLRRVLEEGKILWVFPCTMLLWVNMHGGFLAGIGLVLLYIVGELLNRKTPLPYLWIILSILPITLINPYGLALWRFVIEAALMPRPLIPEWHPISLSGPMESVGGIHVHYLTGYMILVALTLVAACRSLLRERKTDWTKVIVIVALFFRVLSASVREIDPCEALLSEDAAQAAGGRSWEDKHGHYRPG